MASGAWREIEIYVGIAFQPNGMAFCVSGTRKDEKNNGKSTIVHLWEDKKVSINNLLNQITNFISEFIKVSFEIDSPYTDYLHIFFIHKNNLVDTKLKTLETQDNRVVIYTKSLEPITPTEDAIGLISSCINDENLIIGKTVDFESVKNQLDNIVLEVNKTLPPNITAVNYSLGELLYRQLTNQEYYINNNHRFSASNQALRNVFLRLSGRYPFY